MNSDDIIPSRIVYKKQGKTCTINPNSYRMHYLNNLSPTGYPTIDCAFTYNTQIQPEIFVPCLLADIDYFMEMCKVLDRIFRHEDGS